MTTYTAPALKTAVIAEFGVNDGFRNALLANEAVRLDGIGHAFFEQEQEEARDYWSEGATYIVFRVEGFDGSLAYWKWHGNYSSYDGYKLDTYGSSGPFEVKAGKVSRIVWESK